MIENIKKEKSEKKKKKRITKNKKMKQRKTKQTIQNHFNRVAQSRRCCCNGRGAPRNRRKQNKTKQKTRITR